MKKYQSLLFAALLPATLHAQSFVSEGPWRGVFHQPNGAEVPFNFEIKGKSAATAKVFLLNGPEHFATSGVTQKGDSLFIAFDQFDNELAVKIDGRKMSGVLRKKVDLSRAYLRRWRQPSGETYQFCG